jgi:hypothetical protein
MVCGCVVVGKRCVGVHSVCGCVMVGVPMVGVGVYFLCGCVMVGVGVRVCIWCAGVLWWV